MLLDRVPELTHVIDLTNTNRYYDSYQIRDGGVGYTKVATQGHEVPSVTTVRE